MDDKKQILINAVKDFKQSKQETRHYVDLIFHSNRVLKQGDGLIWSEVRAIIHDVLDGSV
jgi:hypothetical protein